MLATQSRSSVTLRNQTRAPSGSIASTRPAASITAGTSSHSRFGPKLEREQVLLGRFVDLGTELFALTAACSRAHALGTPEAIELADFFARLARLKIARLFHALHHHTDRPGYRLAQRVLAGDYAWLEAGVLRS